MTDEEVDPEISVLRRLNGELAEAEVLRDTGELDRLLDDDYLGVDPSGALLTKEKIIKTYGAGDVRLESIVTSDLRIRRLGETSIITGRSMIKGQAASGEFVAVFRYTDVYQKGADGWKLVSSQLTPMLAEAPLLA